MSKQAVITGAFSYTGAAVAQEILNRGWDVSTLTNRTPSECMKGITASPLRFEYEYLREVMSGADVFINTYWVRYPFKGMTFEKAIENTKILLSAVKDAGIPRFVHVSVSNADKGTNLGYYRGKCDFEKMVIDGGVSHAIVRPTLIVGPNDVLTNNIAWFLRRFPIFFVPGGGNYRLQPITLNDTARIIADAVESKDSYTVDAAGPEVFTFREYVECIAKACHLKRLLINTPNWMSLAAIKAIEPVLGDIILTREELLGLEQELLYSHSTNIGKSSVSEWLKEYGGAIGRDYVNDIKRHFKT